MAYDVPTSRSSPTPRITPPSTQPTRTRKPRAGTSRVTPQTPTPTPGGETPQPSPYYGTGAPSLTNLVPLTGNGGAGGGGGAGGEGWGSFGNYDQWAAQYAAEHGGQQPDEQAVYDFWDSQNFMAMTGRAPTQDEWLNRYYSGSWFGGGGGGGWGGGGGYGGYGGGGQQMPFGWNPNLTFWNYR
jgi:hypothetical protein